MKKLGSMGSLALGLAMMASAFDNSSEQIGNFSKSTRAKSNSRLIPLTKMQKRVRRKNKIARASRQLNRKLLKNK